MSSMIYDLAIVEDRGTHWQVVNVVKNTFDTFIDKQEKTIKLSFVSHHLIKQALLDGKKILINKTLRANEVMPGEFQIVDLKETSPIEDARNASLVKIRMLVTPELSRMSGLTMYGFIILNNDLSSAGYFITNQNREEKYLEILETGDEKLIAKLEDYLNYKDEIEGIAHLERQFSVFKNEVKAATTMEEVKAMEERFLEKFFSGF